MMSAWASVWFGEHGGWWRLLLTCAICWFCFEFVGPLIVLSIDDTIAFHNLYQKAHGVEKSALWLGRLVFSDICALICCFVAIRTIHHKPIHVAFSDGQSFRIILAIQSACFWLVVWLIGVAFHTNGITNCLQRIKENSLLIWLELFVAIFSVTAVQAGTEELFYRGYLQNRILAWVNKPWIAVGITAAMFSIWHSHTNVQSKIELAAKGIAWGLVAWRTGSVAPSIAVHAMGNTLASISLLDSQNANRTWLEMSIKTVQLALWCGWLLWATRKNSSQMLRDFFFSSKSPRSLHYIQ